MTLSAITRDIFLQHIRPYLSNDSVQKLQDAVELGNLQALHYFAGAIREASKMRKSSRKLMKIALTNGETRRMNDTIHRND